MKLMGVDDLLRFVAAARPRTTRSIAGSLQAARLQRADPDVQGTRRPLRTSDRSRQVETDGERAPRARGRPRPRRGTRIAPRRVAWLWIVLLASGAGAGCGGSHAQPPTTTRTNIHRTTTNVNRAPAPPARRDVYAADRPGNLSPVVRGMPAYVYVPNSQSDTVDVIDQRTFRVIGQFPVGALPQHVTPSYDLKTLWVDNDMGNSLTPINPWTARPGRPVPVVDPYNLYFTVDGRYAIVVAERLRRLDFRDPHSMRLRHSLAVPGCAGVDHMDFNADGRFALASCEFGARLIVVDIPHQRVARTIDLRPGVMPQDVKLAPDGSTFYIADMNANGVWLVSAETFRVLGFIHTGTGAHGLYANRDSRYLYVSNRGEGSVSVVSFATQRQVKKWRLPGGGSPDMGGVSADGRVLWLSGRYNSEVYAISTITGKLIRRIPVGSGPHGLCVYPQPGRFSLGHTGVFR